MVQIIEFRIASWNFKGEYLSLSPFERFKVYLSLYILGSFGKDLEANLSLNNDASNFEVHSFKVNLYYL